MTGSCGGPWHYESHSFHSACPACGGTHWTVPAFRPDGGRDISKERTSIGAFNDTVTDVLHEGRKVMASDAVRDPVHREGTKWWFWDETWADRLGPYESEGIAREALDQYVKEYLK